MDMSQPQARELLKGQQTWTWRARHSGVDLARVRTSDYRDPYARDRARLLHAGNARRLQGQSLVPGLMDSERPRSRMTLVLESSQIARGMLRALQHLHAPGEPWLEWLPDVNGLEAIALGRQLGHAPFGAVGDAVLAELMKPFGGLDPAVQSLRVVTRLEPHTPGHGLDLTRRTLLGMTPRTLLGMVPESKQAGEAISWQEWLLLPLSDRDRRALLEPSPSGIASRALTLDASMVALAAELAAAVHELDDAIALGSVQQGDWSRLSVDPGWAEAVELDLDAMAEALFGSEPDQARRSIGTLVNALLISVEVETDTRVDEPLLHHRVQWLAPARRFLESLRAMVTGAWARDERVIKAQSQARVLVHALWQTLMEHPQRLGWPQGAALERDALARGLADRLCGQGDAQMLALAARCGLSLEER